MLKVKNAEKLKNSKMLKVKILKVKNAKMLKVQKY